MTGKTVPITDRLYEYVLSVSWHEPEVLRCLREETAILPEAGMQIAADQGRFMAWLVELLGARNILEIGVFTGYSSTCMALALPPEGRITALDISEDFTRVARRYWTLAGVAGKIDLHLGPALNSLQALVQGGARGAYDVAFIDADKTNYVAYYEAVLELLRPGGLVIVDNVLWNGRVADPAALDSDTQAIRSLNARILDDARVSSVLLTVADGLMLARKL